MGEQRKNGHSSEEPTLNPWDQTEDRRLVQDSGELATMPSASERPLASEEDEPSQSGTRPVTTVPPKNAESEKEFWLGLVASIVVILGALYWIIEHARLPSSH